VRLKKLVKLKNPVTSSGIEPTTFRLVAQSLNQIRVHPTWKRKCKEKLSPSAMSQDEFSCANVAETGKN
jgi:hypothetical protein